MSLKTIVGFSSYCIVLYFMTNLMVCYFKPYRGKVGVGFKTMGISVSIHAHFEHFISKWKVWQILIPHIAQIDKGFGIRLSK